MCKYRNKLHHHILPLNVADFFAQVGSADSLGFYRSLTRLDLSHNPLGTPPEGQPFKAYDALRFAFMWREAPLKYVNLAHTGG